MKNQLMRIAIAVFAASFLFLSCKKDKDTAYYLKFKVNGTWITWKKALGELGPDLVDDTKTNFGLSALSDDETDLFNLSFQVDGPSLGTGTYDSDNYFMPIDYTLDYGQQSMKHYDMDHVNGMPDPYFTVTLTSITDKEIRGTFTGNYLVEWQTDEVLTLTEGEFVVPNIR